MPTDKSTPVAAPKAPSILDTQCRDNLIAVALREILDWQFAEGKSNEPQAAVMAVRIANAVMVERGNTVNPTVVVAKGMKVDPAIPGHDTSVAAVVDGEKVTPKTIAEIIGEAEPVAELK